jgi:hypothetical protein
MKMKLLLEISPEHMIVSRWGFRRVSFLKNDVVIPLTKAGTRTKMIDVRFRRGKLECRRFGSKITKIESLDLFFFSLGREQKGKT